MRIKRLIVAVLLMVSAFGVSSCDRHETAKDYPLFWTWLDYRPGMDFEAVCRKMNAAGIDGVMLNAPSPDDYRAAIPLAREYGIRVYAWLWTMNLEHDRERVLSEHPEWLSVNRLGRSLADTTAYVDYYKFLCPALPEVREYLNDRIKEYCEVEGLEGIAIDYHRFVDVVLPTTLWPRYGVVQDKEYPEWDFGYHPAMIGKFVEQYGYDPRAEEDPSQDVNWRQFRCDQITEVANLFAQTVHSYGKKMGASPFPTPKMASRMVRQDWGKWDLDFVFPMAYHNFYTLDPSFEYDCTVENVRDTKPSTMLGCGIMMSDQVFECMDEAFRGGAEAISVFTVQSLRSEEQISRFKAYSDSVRALRAANGGVLPKVRVPGAADVNPFSHDGLIKLIENRIAKDVSGEEALPSPVRLGEFTFVDEYDITRNYEVTELLSGIRYAVTFYLYGDVISGWDVRRAL